VSLLVALIVTFGMSCGGDDDDNGEQQASGTGGSVENGGNGDSNQGGSGGTSENTNMDSGTVDGNLPVVELVPLNGVCTINIPMSAGSGITGTCRATEAECEGGTFVFELSVPEIPADFNPEDYGLPADFDISSINIPDKIEDKNANCEEGLICCIDTDTCESTDTSTYGDYVESVSCVSAGSCADGYEIPFGCPSGQACCAKMNLEAGVASFLDAGQP
jgi:hypothetical protein